MKRRNPEQSLIHPTALRTRARPIRAFASSRHGSAFARSEITAAPGIHATNGSDCQSENNDQSQSGKQISRKAALDRWGLPRSRRRASETWHGQIEEDGRMSREKRSLWFNKRETLIGGFDN
jgi:hypothetical protein